MIASAIRIPTHCAPHLNARFISAPLFGTIGGRRLGIWDLVDGEFIWLRH